MRTTYKSLLIMHVLKVFWLSRYVFPFWVLDEVSSLDSTTSLGDGAWGDICRKVLFLMELVGTTFMSCQIHFHMGTHPVKNCQGHFWKEGKYYFGYKANSCIIFFLIKVSHLSYKLLKIGENQFIKVMDKEGPVMKKVAHYSVFTFQTGVFFW